MSAKMRHLSLYLFIVAFISACSTAQASTPAPSPTPFTIQAPNPYTPQPGDDKLADDTVEFVSAGVIQSGTIPGSVQLDIAYRLPTPCHQVRVVLSPVGSDNQIKLKMYSLFEKDKPCTLMPLATPLHLTLDLGTLPAGHYTVVINDVQAAEFSE